MSELEFGAPMPKQNPKYGKPSPEKMDELIQAGKTPEQFLSSYDFDETQRDVIVFRKPTIRDIQINDVCEFDNGVFGVIVGIRSITMDLFRLLIYQFGIGFSTNKQHSLTMKSPIHFTDSIKKERGDAGPNPIDAQELQIIAIPGASSIKDVKTTILQTMQSPRSYETYTIPVSAIKAIYKNIWEEIYRKIQNM